MNNFIPFETIRQRFVLNRMVFVNSLIIIVLLIISALQAFIIPKRFLPIILFLFLGVVIMLAIMKWPPLGLIAVIGSIIIPFNGPSHSNATLALAALLLGLWLLDMVVRQRQIKLWKSPAIRPLIAFIIIAFFALGIGQLPWFNFAQHAPLGVQLAGLAIFILSAGIFLLVAHQIRDIRWLKFLTWFFIILGGLFILGHWLPSELREIVLSLFNNGARGSMFWTWLVVLALSQAIINKDLQPLVRILLGGLVIATMYILVFRVQDWKSGWIPVLVSIVTLIGLLSWRIALLLILPSVRYLPIAFSRLIASDQYSYSTRLEAWKILADIIKVNPLLGLGPANYYWYTPLFSIRGYSVQFNSHNQYFDIIAQTGLLGLSCYLWFFWEITRLGWKLRTQVPQGFALAFVYGVLGGIAGTLAAGMLGDWILPFFYNITLSGFRVSMLPWLFFGGLIAIENIYSTKIA